MMAGRASSTAGAHGVGAAIEHQARRRTAALAA